MSPEYYEPTWNSLKRHRQPEWLDDAKFGIYFHWGPYSVPAWGSEWYPFKMYRPHTKEFKHHKETFGDQSEFGYKDLIPKFTAEHFNADEWAALFKQAGAQFAGPVAEHHDGFSMWASKVNRWNAKNMGPKRDIVGEMEKAIRKQGMKFICTFHHAHNWYHYYHSSKYDTGNPEYSDLYGPIHNLDDKRARLGLKLDRPSKEFCEIWLAKCKEVIDNYQPDLIWFDFCLKWIHDDYKRAMVAYYYNKGLEWDKEVEILYKGHDLPPGVGLLDYERGRSFDLTHYKWITDTALGNKSWSYVDNEQYKSMSSVIHNFINNISRNGYLLMNFGPKANGEITQENRNLLLGLGKWIEINKDAIFGATPWVIPGEGPTKPKKVGMFSEDKEVVYTSQDLRFVTKGRTVYIFALGWPGKELVIKSFVKSYNYAKFWRKPWDAYIIEPTDIASVKLVGVDRVLDWTIENDGMHVKIPDNIQIPGDHAYTFAITWAN
jgi:alpha-L-fucosidase